MSKGMDENKCLRSPGCWPQYCCRGIVKLFALIIVIALQIKRFTHTRWRGPPPSSLLETHSTNPGPGLHQREHGQPLPCLKPTMRGGGEGRLSKGQKGTINPLQWNHNAVFSLRLIQNIHGKLLTYKSVQKTSRSQGDRLLI